LKSGSENTDVLKLEFETTKIRNFLTISETLCIEMRCTIAATLVLKACKNFAAGSCEAANFGENLSNGLQWKECD
jgi:hypothetical protein